METITLKINTKSKAGKLLKDLLNLIADKPGVQIVEEKSPYSPEFVKKIKESKKQIEQGKCFVLDPENIWESIGL